MIKQIVFILATLVAFNTASAQETDTLFVMPLSLDKSIKDPYYHSITKNLNKNLLQAIGQTNIYRIKRSKQITKELASKKLSLKKLTNLQYRTKHAASISSLFSFIVQGEVIFPKQNELSVSVRLIQTSNNAIVKSTALRERIDTMEKLSAKIIETIFPTQDEVLQSIRKKYKRAFKKKNYPHAKLLCDWALRIRPLYADFLYFKAQVLEKQKNYINAQKLYKEAKRMRYKNPQNIDKALQRIRPYAQKSKKGYQQELQSLFKEFEKFEKKNVSKEIVAAATQIQLKLKKITHLQKVIDVATSLQKDTKNFILWMNQLHGSTFSDKKRTMINNMRQKIEDFKQRQKTATEQLQKYPAHSKMFLDKCTKLQRKKDYDKALYQAKLAILVNPKDAEGYYHKGICLGKKYKHQQAIFSFSQAIAIDSNHWQSIYNRAMTYLALENTNKTISDLKSVLKIHKHAPTYYELGKIYLAQNKDKKAQLLFTNAINRDPTLAAAYYERGKISDKQNQFVQASQDYKKAMALDKALATKVSALYDKSKSYISQQAYIYLEMGQDYQQYGELEAASNFYKKAISLNPQLYQAFFHQAQILHIQKKYKIAVKNYSKALRINPEKPEIHKYRCISFIKLGNFEKALQDVEDALKHDPNISGIYLLKGQIYEGLHQKSNNPSYLRLALQSYDLAVKLLPSKSHYYMERSRIYKQLGRNEEALQDQIYARNLKK
ncbi:hypothetical protein [Candidatus Uabimicrobium sp. HlEnr_7]|uniref:tetratricopeptide repeat protein n=1 Tax=Candidatus Uabimicrobium helgolandensis TaxID=3095367 RepID=UPI0035572385